MWSSRTSAWPGRWSPATAAPRAAPSRSLLLDPNAEDATRAWAQEHLAELGDSHPDRLVELLEAHYDLRRDGAVLGVHLVDALRALGRDAEARDWLAKLQALGAATGV